MALSLRYSLIFSIAFTDSAKSMTGLSECSWTILSTHSFFDSIPERSVFLLAIAHTPSLPTNFLVFGLKHFIHLAMFGPQKRKACCIFKVNISYSDLSFSV